MEPGYHWIGSCPRIKLSLEWLHLCIAILRFWTPLRHPPQRPINGHLLPNLHQIDSCDPVFCGSRYASRNTSFSSLLLMLPIQFSPVATVMFASRFFPWIISLIFSSKVSLVMNRWTMTLLFWPMR